MKLCLPGMIEQAIEKAFIPWVTIFIQISALFFMMCYIYTVITVYCNATFYLFILGQWFLNQTCIGYIYINWTKSCVYPSNQNLFIFKPMQTNKVIFNGLNSRLNSFSIKLSCATQVDSDNTQASYSCTISYQSECVSLSKMMKMWDIAWILVGIFFALLIS